MEEMDQIIKSEPLDMTSGLYTLAMAIQSLSTAILQHAQVEATKLQFHEESKAWQAANPLQDGELVQKNGKLHRIIKKRENENGTGK